MARCPPRSVAGRSLARPSGIANVPSWIRLRQGAADEPGEERDHGRGLRVRVETIEEPVMREIRYLDKLVDELARGKAMAKILREQ
jgi:hypothetical protein